ncbi:MAG: hypothetical protein P4L33_03640 [Capsulimonadaceae bacterium]|nr:hypothetical protein [Capsulimonadaceae bacterium]
MGAAVFCVTLITLNFGWVAIHSLSLTSEEATSSGYNEKARIAMDTIRQDLLDSDAVEEQYAFGGTTYTSGPSTLILELPWHTFSGTSVTTGDDYVLYHLVGSAAPYTLNRYLITSAGSPRGTINVDSVLVGTLMNGKSSTAIIKDIVFTYYAHLKATGDGSTTTFALQNAPVISTTAARSSGIVNRGGTAVSLTATSPLASFTSSGTNGSLVFTTAPSSQTAIDALYPIDASQYSSSAIMVVVQLDFSTTNNSLISTASSQSLEIGTEGKLRGN